MKDKKQERLLKGDFSAVAVVTKEKAHDLINATYFPASLIALQAELLHPYHNGLFVRLIMRYGEEFKSMQDPADFLTLLATDLEIKLDGMYTLDEVANTIFTRIRDERRLASVVELPLAGVH